MHFALAVLVWAALASTASALVVAPACPMRAAVPVAASRTAAPEMLIGRSWILAVRKTMPQFPMFRKGGSRAGGIRGADGGDGGMGSTAGSSDDEGDSTPMMQMWKRYEQLLEETPLLMKALTSLTGFALGDILAQKVIQKVDSFDFLRLLRLASFGFLVHGTSSHVFYGWLDGKFPGTSAQVVFAKVLVDQVFWAPIFGMMFFSYIAAAELKGLGNVFDKMKDELVTQVDGVPVPEGPFSHRRRHRSSSSPRRCPFYQSALPDTAPRPNGAARCFRSAACVRSAGDRQLDGVAAGTRDQLPNHPVLAARAVHQHHPDRLQLLPLAHCQPRADGGARAGAEPGQGQEEVRRRSKKR